jgi:multiple sugar transport system substrate-binding protein
MHVSPASRPRTRRLAAITVCVAAALALTACGGSGGGGQADDGPAKLTMWVRDATGAYSKALVDAYNGSPKDQIKLTVIPNDNYQQKIGQAAGSHSLPDLVASDVVYSPNYVSKGLFADITGKLKALPFYSTLAQAHTKAASQDGKIYAVPHKVDSSVILYNKDLFTKAGLDPENPPKTYDEIYSAAKKIHALGKDTYGFYIAGNCGGCNAYTAMPYGVAAGHPTVSDDGKSADLDNDALKAAFANYKRMFDEGIIPASAKTDNGATWTSAFLAGKVGMLPAGSFAFADTISKAHFDWGVMPLATADGSKSATFVGGDVLAISQTSAHKDAAWDFIAWSLGDKAQTDIVAKGGDLPVRSDLAENRYSAAHPQIVATIKGLANGWTPSSVGYGPAFNDPNGPWNAAVRGAVFGDDPDKALTEGQQKIDALLTSGG